MLSVLSVGLMVLVAVAVWPCGAARFPAVGHRYCSGVADPGRRRQGNHGRRDGRRARLRLQSELADAVALVAAPLRSGVPPAGAVRAAAEALEPDAALAAPMRELCEAAASGDSLAKVWLHHAEVLDGADLRFVGQAWLLSERTGAPLAEALARAEEVLRSRHRAQERVASAAAGPRASMAVLAVLPLTGPLMGLAFGLGPTDLYLGSPASTVSLGVGVALALLAWWWSRRIVAAALRSGACAAAVTAAGSGAGPRAGVLAPRRGRVWWPR